MNSLSSLRPDIAILSPNGRVVASVEVQNLLNFTRKAATEIRYNMLVDGLLTRTPYFLVMSQDKGYLWKDPWQEGDNVPPTFEFPTSNIFPRYVKREPGERLYEVELELLAFQWLTDLAKGKQTISEEPEKTLAQAGFIDCIKDATVILEDKSDS
jgi:hypothetical protein